MTLLTLAALAPLAVAAELDPLFAASAAEHQVPEPLLKALAWEASRLDPDVVSAWGGYGLFDLREDAETQGPGIEQVALLIGESPDDIMVEPALQIEGAAALLAWHAHNLGALPEVDELESWAGAVAGFSGRHDPELQAMFVSFIYTVVAEGFAGPQAALVGQDVDIDLARDSVFEVPVAPPNPTGDYYANSQFVSAHSSNYSNYSRTSSDINYIVIHTVQGPTRAVSPGSRTPRPTSRPTMSFGAGMGMSPRWCGRRTSPGTPGTGTTTTAPLGSSTRASWKGQVSSTRAPCTRAQRP